VYSWSGLKVRLTLDGQDHALADVGAHPVGGLTQVVAPVLLQDVTNQQGAVPHDLDPTGQRHWVVLLGVPCT
jgi:hypothetical protein